MMKLYSIIALSWALCTIFAIIHVDLATSVPSKGHDDTRPESKIIGGAPITKNEFPFLARIQMILQNNPRNWCGGTIYNSKFILSAAHCFLDGSSRLKRSPTLFRVIAGDHSIGNGEFSEQRRNVLRIHMQPDYEKLSAQLGVAEVQLRKPFDIAILELDKPLNFSNARVVAPLRIPSKGRSEDVPVGNAISIGWGITKFNGVRNPTYPDIPHKVNLPIIPERDCYEGLAGRNLSMTWGMICAGYFTQRKDTCTADSGGPLVCSSTQGENEGGPDGNDAVEKLASTYLCGIVATGVKGSICADNVPGFYTNVGHFRNWILKIAGNVGGLGM